MAHNLGKKLIASHLLSGEMTPWTEIGLRIDQTLTQDATGPLVMLELEALGLDRARTEVSVQYIDHNLLQADSKNAEDHDSLRSACQRFGRWFSNAGNGVSHPTHMQWFGSPGETMVGSDSHTPAAGSRAMPLCSNIPKLARFTFDQVDKTYAACTTDPDGIDGVLWI